MTPISANIPVFVVQQYAKVTVTRPQFVYAPQHPELVAVRCDEFVLWVSREGLYAGLVGRHVEACGDVTIFPYRDGPFTWLVLDIDTGALPGAQVSASAVLVAEFLDRVYDLVPAGLEAEYAVLADEDRFAAAVGSWLAGAA